MHALVSLVALNLLMKVNENGIEVFSFNHLIEVGFGLQRTRPNFFTFYLFIYFFKNEKKL